jgi:prolyl-tRNA synthetase
MKDLYTFDTSPETGMDTYFQVREAYNNFFDELGVPYLIAEADSGNMGGKLSHEYHFASPLGEDTVWFCDKCDYTANDEVAIGRNSNPAEQKVHGGDGCPKCDSGHLDLVKTIEIGHTFNLGTRYSVPLEVTFTPSDPSASPAPVYMGCHGIGVSRLIGALASMLARPTGHASPPVGLRWPLPLAPFVVVVTAADVHKMKGDLEMVYDLINRQLTRIEGPYGAGDVVLDDRDTTLPWKLKDADLIGYPIVVMLGRKWDKDKLVAVHDRISGSTLEVPVDSLMGTLHRILNSPPSVGL